MWADLKQGFSGELYYDDSSMHSAVRMSYATDASVYQERPMAVAIPKTIEDIKNLVLFAGTKNLTLIPRLHKDVVGSE